MADRNKKGIVILVNKWDKIEKETSTSLEFEKKIKAKILPFDDVPILFVSALTKNRLIKSIEVALSVFKNKSQKITTSKLNDTMLDIIKNTPPPVKGKYIKIKYCTQLTKSPSFVFFANLPQYIKEPYKRCENKLRENFNFKGVPIDIFQKEVKIFFCAKKTNEKNSHFNLFSFVYVSALHKVNQTYLSGLIEKDVV